MKTFVVLATLVAPSLAVADPKFEYGKAEEVAKVKAVEFDAADYEQTVREEVQIGRAHV